MKKILITGATGFIGSHLAKRLCASGHTVSVLVRNNSDKRNLEGLPVVQIPGDITDRAAVARAVSGQDVVFHMAALVAFWVPRDQLSKFHEVNVEGSKNVFDACLDAGTSKVIYTSTLSSIGSFGAHDLTTEDHSFNMWDMSMEYERSKLNAEFEAWRYCARGLPLVALLPSAPVGAKDIKPAPAGQLIIDFLNGRIPVYMDGGANFLHVDDAARAHELAMEKGKVGERYLIGGQNISIRELFDAIENLTGVRGPRIKAPASVAVAYAGLLEWVANNITGKAPLLTVPMTKFSSLHYYLDTTLAQRDLGYQPEKSLELAVLEAIEWFEGQGYLALKSKVRQTVYSGLQAAGAA